ncbi:MAG: hypothetical protein IJ811_02795, partial [Clostridia bacterium]|nr:hypothetical protein [Clostridia bacterium]
MSNKAKKPFSLKKTLLFSIISAVVAVALIVGNVIAYGYEGLLDTFFSSSDYKVSESEQLVCREIVEEG